MADTKHHPSGLAGHEPVEGDGISYSGLGWFVVILTVTTLFCAGLVWAMYGFMERREVRRGAAAVPLAASPGTLPPGPNLLVDEPAHLRDIQQAETSTLTTYGWIDRNGSTVRIPIDRAKELVLERGLPVRGAPEQFPATRGGR